MGGKSLRCISRSLIAILIVIVVIIAGLAAYFILRAPAPVAPKPIVIGVTDKVTDLDPSNAYDFFTWEVLSNIMEGLVRYKPGSLDLEPALAESWSVSSDGMTWTFKLREGLKFADGTPLTAGDVVRSINRVMAISGDPSWLVVEFVDKVEAPDNYTVVFKLKQPTPFFLTLIATPPYFPVHPAYAPESIDSDQTAGGAGPYKIARFQRDVEIVLEPNPYYYGDKPKSSIVIRFYADATSLRLAIEGGEVDIAWRTLRPTDIEELSKKADLKVIEVPGTFIRYICINTRMPPFDNKLVRQALAVAINRTEIISIALRGAGTPLYSLVPIGMWSHVDAFKEKYGDYNVELARNLLRQAGYSEENKLAVELWYTPTHYGDTEKDIAALLKQQWEAVGLIEVTVKSAEWTTYVSYIRNGQLPVYLLGWYPDYLDPDNYLTPFLLSTANSWAGTGYANETVDELLKQASSIVDQSERELTYINVQRLYLAEDVPYIPIFQGKLYIVIRQDIEGVVPNPIMLMYYWPIYRK